MYVMVFTKKIRLAAKNSNNMIRWAYTKMRLVKGLKRFKGLFIGESALSQFTGTPLRYLETNNSNITQQD